MKTANEESEVVNFVEPSREEWKRLHEAAIRFRDLAPWNWMEETDLFGVQNPETGEVGYVCIMGMAGEHFALNLYLGTSGLRGFFEMRDMSTTMRAPDAAEYLHTQDCIALSFEDRDFVTKRDRDVVKSLGLKFRGAAAWPEFRRYKPDFMSWYIEAPEARFLTVALVQAIEVAPRFRADSQLLPRATRNGPYLVRVSSVLAANGNVVWRDVLRKQVPALPQERRASAPVQPPADLAERARKIGTTLPQVEADLEVDYIYLIKGIMGDASTGGRPTMPQIALFVDGQSGAVIDTQMLTSTGMERELPEKLFHLLENLSGTGVRPGIIYVKRERTFAILKPYEELLDIPIERLKFLAGLEEAQQSISGMMLE